MVARRWRCSPTSIYPPTLRRTWFSGPRGWPGGVVLFLAISRSVSTATGAVSGTSGSVACGDAQYPLVTPRTAPYP